MLRFEGAGLTLRAAGDLTLEARRLTLHAEESLALSTGGDLDVTVTGDLRSTARTPTITADLGDVRVEANDNVKIDGERVLSTAEAAVKLENSSPFPAHLFRGGIDEHRLFGSVAVRVSHDVVGDRLRVAREQTWPISPGPWDSPYGPLPADDLFYRGGVDLLVFGAARSVRPVPRIDLHIRVGERFKARVVVFGDRTWKRDPRRGLVAGAPEPFRELPLTLAYSYGGKFQVGRPRRRPPRQPRRPRLLPRRARRRGQAARQHRRSEALAPAGTTAPNRSAPARPVRASARACAARSSSTRRAAASR